MGYSVFQTGKLQFLGSSKLTIGIGESGKDAA
jgi:hypothetical protein